MQINEYMQQLGQAAKAASKVVARASSASKNLALLKIAESLNARREDILRANIEDVQAGKEKDLSPALLDRLALDHQRIDAMIEGLKQIAALPDPVGEMSDFNQRPSGISVGKMRVPLGVIGIIYESRPNVSIDAASLCIKSGNATILRGGSEAIRSNKQIANCIAQGLEEAELPPAAVSLVTTVDRGAVEEMIVMDNLIDVIIPRGGKGLIKRVSAGAKVPVIKHLDGICHMYIDDAADVSKAVALAHNAKCRRFGICGAMETLLVHEQIAEVYLPLAAEKLLKEGVELRGCERTLNIITAKLAKGEDWSTEYLAPILSIKVVKSMESAMSHIENYGSGHTDAIVTENHTKAMSFIRRVDSSSVMINASTQFADGFEYGLGAEIGISTNKLHARGPVGLHGLTSQKWVVLGSGNIRD